MKITNESCIYTMSSQIEPVIKINSGDIIEIETKDCFSNRIIKNDMNFENYDFSDANPATGPIYINNAVPGDILEVKIHKIDINNQGVLFTAPEVTPLGNEIDNVHAKIVNIENNEILFNDNIKIPVNKMIGVIGVAPTTGEIRTNEVGEHGGNLDCVEISESSSVFLPVNCDGALLSLGDVHAAMANGELSVSSAEVSSLVTIEVIIHKSLNIVTPSVLYKDDLIILSSHEDINQGIKEITKKTFDYIKRNQKLDKFSTIELMSLVGNLEFAQVVNKQKTLKIKINKKYLSLEDLKN